MISIQVVSWVWHKPAPDDKTPVLGIWEVWSTFSLPLLPGPLWLQSSCNCLNPINGTNRSVQKLFILDWPYAKKKKKEKKQKKNNNKKQNKKQNNKKQQKSKKQKQKQNKQEKELIRSNYTKNVDMNAIT